MEVHPTGRLIGEIFVEMGVITEEQLADALEQQGKTSELLGEILVSRFGVSRLTLATVLAEQRAEQHATPADTERSDKDDLPDVAPQPLDVSDALTGAHLDSALAPLRATIKALEANLESLRARVDALEQVLPDSGEPEMEVGRRSAG